MLLSIKQGPFLRDSGTSSSMTSLKVGRGESSVKLSIYYPVFTKMPGQTQRLTKWLSKRTKNRPTQLCLPNLLHFSTRSGCANKQNSNNLEAQYKSSLYGILEFTARD